MRKDVLKNYKIHGDHGDYLIYLLHYILKNEFVVKEVPYVLVPRSVGESKTTENYLGFFLKGCQYLWAIIYLALFEKYRTN